MIVFKARCLSLCLVLKRDRLFIRRADDTVCNGGKVRPTT